MVIQKTALLLVLLGGAGTMGCIIVPLPRSTQDEGIRATLHPEEVAFLRPGETRRRDVLLNLGEPDETCVMSREYSCYLAHTSRTDIHWGVFLPIPPRGAMVSGVSRQGSRKFLLIRFDDSGVVEKFKYEKIPYTLTGNAESAHKSVADLVREWDETEAD